ncbi:hypothetical protein PCHAJ_000491700 [Plasmodium chabaudi chabaudi]|uniref:Uncharacterized protein n=1 Tax=Plasmodium chabaudi chabaudi TaxID=31271 RepID=A0A1C6W9K8_PLACU|nr:hypothetical protein PCHAJ_000491700 [Plasmodium chabaudi chabaudi]
MYELSKLILSIVSNEDDLTCYVDERLTRITYPGKRASWKQCCVATVNQGLQPEGPWVAQGGSSRGRWLWNLWDDMGID